MGPFTSAVVKTAFALLVVTGAASGCSASVSIGGRKLTKSKVEKKTAEELAKQNNLPEPKITCPGDLAAKVGTKMDCTLTPQGDTQTIPVHLEVDSVADDGTAHFNISVGDVPDASTSTSQP